MNTRKIDVSLLITFHSEGILAQMTLNSVERCRLYAEQHGISCEYVWVMDNIDDETKRILNEYPIDSSIVQKIEVSHGDSGASRNSGITIAKGTAIAILDGDDYYSTNWIERGWNTLKEYGYNSIIHPEFVLNFGTVKIYNWQIDQKADYFNTKGLLRDNFWTSAWSMAHRTVYLNVPYKATYANKTGYAFEDWHWNCQTISEGYEHRLASKTIGFYRRKKVSRRNELETTRNELETTRNELETTRNELETTRNELENINNMSIFKIINRTQRLLRNKGK